MGTRYTRVTKVAIKIIDKKMMQAANAVSEKDKATREKRRREKAKERGETLPEDPPVIPQEKTFVSNLEVHLIYPERGQTFDAIGSPQHHQNLSSDRFRRYLLCGDAVRFRW